MVSKTVEVSFPSNIERSVASALLSLSSCPSVGMSGGDGDSPESLESTAISALRSGGSPAEVEASVDDESSSAQQLMAAAFVSGSHDLKLKIVQKKRSKSIYISNGKKPKTSSKPVATPAFSASSETFSEITTEASSCLSSNSSGQSLGSKTSAADKGRKPVIPSHMSHKAAAIMRFLADGSASEVMIRQLLGDSPSTSKALRMLLKLQAVKRFGAGGRSDPYIYMIA
ncbi:uncharacterized protein LOC130999930 [Salvia miltiorrhiza]|uniref:uncharacterized protein LOC130999930 n=1 Tax=Salvia miltiorrhiza TaxID=226208 RepID=UPI0025AD36CB|nr:uncharacterized protein LOC130999930 [Salvia miltiorrhiza]